MIKKKINFTILFLILFFNQNYHCELASHQNCNKYTLSNILEKSTPELKSFILEAIFSVAPNETNLSTVYCYPMNGGISKSKLFILDINNEKYVFRTLDKTKPTLSRIAEIKAHKKAADLNIAPKIFYVDQDYNFILMQYIDGRVFSHKDLNNDIIIENVTKNLKIWHNVKDPIQKQKKSHLERINIYCKKNILKGVVYPSCFENLLKEVKENKFLLETFSIKPCHGDFNPRNILITSNNQVYFIDWAEASKNPPMYDLAWLCFFSGANEKQSVNLLKTYLKENPTKLEIQELLFYKNSISFFAFICWIGKQQEKDQIILDKLLNSDIKLASDYFKEGISVLEVIEQGDLELTKYTLGFLKEFIISRNKEKKSN